VSSLKVGLCLLLLLLFVVVEFLLSVFIGRRSVMRFHFSDSHSLLLCVFLFATVNLSDTIRQASK
jgi:hypothetical protein